MTDLEITKRCAEAMGLSISPFGGMSPRGGEQVETVTWHGPNGEHPTYRLYDPLHDDAQAMALVKKFSIDLLAQDFIDEHEPNKAHWWVASIGNTEARNADLNRAICECVAKMQESKCQK